MPSRRQVLAASVTALAVPSLVRAESSRVLKFIPQSDLTVIDPIWSTAYIARNHGYMVFDTLFGMDAAYRIQPQMVGAVKIEDDGRRWDLILRDGLMFHDGETVLARDCVASIRRWAARDALGGVLMKTTDELSAPDDRTIRFRLKKPFPRLAYALGKTSTPMCAMMPERFASLDHFKQLGELVGSGPFRFKADERVSGSRAVYEKFDRYVPRPDGAPGWTAGPKIVSFDRVEWHTIPDEGTAAGAMQAGEIDWWEIPTDDLRPVLQKSGRVRVDIKDPTGVIGFLKMNCLQPPFNNPGVRRALLGAFNQEDFVTAIAGTDPRVDAMKQAGMTIDYLAMDWGTAVARREKKAPIDQGGWSGLFTTLSGLDLQGPSGHAFRTSGETGWFGWVSSPRIEELRGQWLDANDLPTQQRIARDIQTQWWIDVPHIPIGQWFQPTAWRNTLDGMVDGFPVFWGIRRT